MPLLLGCIADDFTGATDLANTLVAGGMRTVQVIGVPEHAEDVPDAEAVVVALKSRTAPVGEAVARSRAALAWLRRAGARQFFFKYCSTFDSTAKGNIGPVASALLDDLDAACTIHCPAFPTNRRTVYKGHLFVGDVPLSESSMRDHPLTPMTDANLVRFLGAQTGGGVGLVEYAVVTRGEGAVREALAERAAAGIRHVIADAIDDEHLMTLGAACSDAALVCGGSGLAMGLPENFRRAGVMAADDAAAVLPPASGLAAVVSGSCSEATLGQVEHMAASRPAKRIDPRRLAAGEDAAGEAIRWARERIADGPVLVYASASKDDVGEVQRELGRERAGALVEEALAAVARGLVDAGVRRLVVAGGETSGAVVRALGVTRLRIGPQIDPGVPWTMSLSDEPVYLALKSGNFGTVDFFTKALERLG